MPDPMTLMAIMTALSGVGSALTSNKGESGSTFNKPQLGVLSDILGQVKGMGKGGAGDIQNNASFQSGQNWLQDLFNDPGFFNSFEAPLKRQFEEEIGPSIANRYAGMGSGGSTGSTGFRNQLARAGTDLSTNLGALRGGLQQQGVGQALQYGQQPVQNYMQMLQQALTPTQNTYQGPSSGPFGGAFAGGMGGMMQGLMNQSYQGGGNGGMGGGGQGYQPQGMSRGYPGQSPLTY